MLPAGPSWIRCWSSLRWSRVKTTRFQIQRADSLLAVRGLQPAALVVPGADQLYLISRVSELLPAAQHVEGAHLCLQEGWGGKTGGRGRRSPQGMCVCAYGCMRGVEGSRGKGSRGIGTRPLVVSGHPTRARGLRLTRSRGLGTWMPGDQVPFGRLRTAGGARREEEYIYIKVNKTHFK